MQASFSDLEYAAKKRVTRRGRFLSVIDAVTPWSALVAEIEPFYPKGDGRGRPPIVVPRLLCMYIAQQRLGLSDEDIEVAIDDSQAIRGFIGIVLNRETAPEASTLLKFRRLLETNNKDRARYAVLHLAKKGNQWHLGMMAHIGVDADSGLTHTLVTTAASVSDINQAHALLHGDESAAFGDAGYRGVEKRQQNQSRSVKWHAALRPGKRRTLPETTLEQLREQFEKHKAIVRATVEHPFHVVENIFGHKRARYRGLTKNTVQPQSRFGLANLMFAKRRLFELHAQGAS